MLISSVQRDPEGRILTYTRVRKKGMFDKTKLPELGKHFTEK
jgi:hypothetical protein